MELIGWRFSVTGAFGYEYCRDGCRLCTVSSLVVPQPAVCIRGFGQNWLSPFAPGPLRPGWTRAALRADTGREAARLAYGPAGYTLCIGTNVCRAVQDGETYRFFAGARQAAVLTRLPPAARAAVPPPALYPDAEAYFKADAAQDLPAEALLLMLAFPMLACGV